MPKDISKMIPSGVNLEKNALDKFGAAVSGQDKKMSFGSTSKASTASQSEGAPSEWISSDYAHDLIKNNVAFNPKLKFMFKVSFKFNPAIIAYAESMGYPVKQLQENLTFIVRHVDRPKHDFDYEEVNLYNFRTKVLKSIRNREVSLTFFDDVGNNGLGFVNMYRQLIQPISRRQFMPSMTHEDYGFDYGSDNNTAWRGPLPNDAKNILEEMTVHQIFVERNSDVKTPSAWVKVVNFIFMNPKFTNIDIDDMDHENGGNFNIITMSVDFDSVFMDHVNAFTTETGGPLFMGGDIPMDGNGGSSAQGGANGSALNQGYRDYATPNFTTISDGGASSVQDTVVGNKVNPLGKTNQSFARPSTNFLADNTTSPSVVESLASQESSDDGEYA